MAWPRRRARTRRAEFPFRGAARRPKRANRPGASHAAVSLSLLSVTTQASALTLPHGPHNGSRRVTSRRHRSTIDDRYRRLARRRASPTIGRFGQILLAWSQELNRGNAHCCAPPAQIRAGALTQRLLPWVMTVSRWAGHGWPSWQLATSGHADFRGCPRRFLPSLHALLISRDSQ